MNRSLLNPYIAGNQVGNRNNFIGRRELLREVKTLLSDPECRHILLYGQRRIGKTSLLYYLEKELKVDKIFFPVFFDLQPLSDKPLADILRELADAIAQKLNLPDPRRALIWEPEETFQKTWLPQVLSQLAEGCSLVLLFDEFDVLAHPDNHPSNADQLSTYGLLEYLPRLLEETSSKLKCISVIGRHRNDLSIAAQSLQKLPQQRLVSLLKIEDTEELIRFSERDKTLMWNDGAVNRVIQLTAGHPYLTQLICYHVWNLKHRVNSVSIALAATTQDVNTVIPDVLKEAGQQQIVPFWDTLSPTERAVAVVIASFGPAPVTQDQLGTLLLESKMRLAMREVDNALQSLRERDLLEEVVGGVHFRVELVRQWIEQNKNIEDLQREILTSGTEAEKQYELASISFQKGDLERALDRTREALVANPYHIKSRQLLAEIFYTQHKLDEALEVLEKLHQDEPKEATDRLIEIYMKRAKDVANIDEKLIWYQKVLKIRPLYRLAHDGVVRIWTDKGSDARNLAKNTRFDPVQKLYYLRMALDAYKKAENQDEVNAIEKEIEPIAVSLGEQELRDLENSEEYKQALERLRVLNENYPRPLWATYRTRLDKLAQIAQWYQEATSALINGNRDLARTQLINVLEQNPKYKDAALLYYEAVTGTNPSRALERLAEVQNQYQDIEAKLKQIHAEYTDAQGQIVLLENKLKESQSTIESLQTKLAQMEHDKQEMTDKYRESVSEKELYEERISSLEEKVSLQEPQLAAINNKEKEPDQQEAQKPEFDWQLEYNQLKAKHKEEIRKLQAQSDSSMRTASERTQEVNKLRSSLERERSEAMKASNYKIISFVAIALFLILAMYVLIAH